MSKQVMTDVWVGFEGLNLSGLLNEVQFSSEADELDSTTFEDAVGGGRDYDAGLVKSMVTYSGMWDPEVGQATRDLLATKGDLLIASHRALGSPSFFARGLSSKVDWSAPVGQLVKATGNLTGSGRHGICEGPLLAVDQTVSTTGSATGRQITGGIATGKDLVAVLQILEVTGSPTFTALVKSSTASNMTSPTTRLTFDAVTAGPGAQLKYLAGPVTDTWFNLTWTVSGSGTVKFAAAVGRS